MRMIALLSILSLAACAGDGPGLTAPDRPLRSTGRTVEVEAHTLYRTNWGTYFTDESGGHVNVEDGGTLIATIEGDGGYGIFGGESLTLDAVANGGGCSFSRWQLSGYGNVTTNPLNLSSYPATDYVKAFFTCTF